MLENPMEKRAKKKKNKNEDIRFPVSEDRTQRINDQEAGGHN